MRKLNESSQSPRKRILEIADKLAESLSKTCHGMHPMVVGKKKDFTIRNDCLAPIARAKVELEYPDE